MPTRSRLTLTAALAAIALTLAGCAGTTTAPSSSPSPTASASQAAVVIPATPAGATTRWVLDLMNAEADTTAADWEGRLTAEFLAEVPAEEIAKLINTSIRPAKPLEATAYEGDERTAVTTIVGQIGDLVESLLKRGSDVKDAASILPGHGGFLDRLDSMLLNAPILYADGVYVLGAKP